MTEFNPFSGELKSNLALKLVDGDTKRFMKLVLTDPSTLEESYIILTADEARKVGQALFMVSHEMDGKGSIQ